MRIMLLFLLKELRDVRTNKQVWPVYLLLPPIALVLPIFAVTVMPGVVRAEAVKGDAVMQSLMRLVQEAGEFAGMSLDEAMSRFLLRNLLAFFLIMPLGISSVSAAFSIVGEKQQRTLEPILATPITDSQFMLGKMLAASVPAVIVTWATALLATLVVDFISLSKYRVALLPDRFWMMGVLVLAPLLAFGAVLATMRISARMTDPQAANQFAGLVIVPAFLTNLALFGKLLTLSFAALCIACLLVLVLDYFLFRLNLRKFQRDEILTRWK
jgi:ABC-2 type transport system permease protein